MKKDVFIDGPYITLGQLLKEESVVSSGGQAKWYLKEHSIDVNGEADDRRGRKLSAGDQVTVPEVGIFFIRSKRDD